jgi:hypothetical protein
LAVVLKITKAENLKERENPNYTIDGIDRNQTGNPLTKSSFRATLSTSQRLEKVDITSVY